jgi:DNA-directed RNA polymerase specialized sigma24 family protein
MSNTLTDTEIAHYCTELLGPTTIHVGRRLGPEAADLVGGCLLLALRKYDKSKNKDLVPWVRYKTRCLVTDALRAEQGRKGSAKYTALYSRSDISAFDAVEGPPEAGKAMEEQETLSAALKRVAQVGRLQRWLIIGGLWGFTNKDIKGIVDVSEREIRSEVSHLRQLLSPN